MASGLHVRDTLPTFGPEDKDQKRGPVAIITGITGQDGSYLTELLLSKGYQNVIGFVRPSSTPQLWRLDQLAREKGIDTKLQLYFGDVLDSSFLRSAIRCLAPDEIYHFAAQSSVAISFSNAEYSTQVNALGTLRILETLKEYLYASGKRVKFYNACTSELFGESPDEIHTETSNFHPKSPYGIAKLHSYWATRHYREAYGLFAVNGILFNHESPRRGELFVTQKIAASVARIAAAEEKEEEAEEEDHVLSLGTLDVFRDWGHAKDYVEGVWRMMHADRADDFVLCSGESHSVREFTELAFRRANIRIRWVDSNDGTTRGVDTETGRPLVKVDIALRRVLDIEALRGDASKAGKMLDWHYSRPFESLVNEMVDCAIEIESRRRKCTD